MYFPQISNKRVPSSVQKSQKQARPRPKHGSPHPSDSPFVLRGRQNYLSTSHESPASSVLRPPPHPTHQPPPSSITPEPIPRRRRPPQPQPQRPPRLVVEAEAEPSVPEPVQPRRPAPHRCRSNFATLHRTGAVPATPSFAASDLLPLRRHTAMATQSTIWPWVRPRLHRPPQLLISSEPQEDRWKNRRRTQHCQQKEVLLFPYSCKSYVSACTVFIPQKTLVDRFFLILDVPSNS